MNREKNVANNLTKFRKARGLTQAELANKLNYSDKSISKWERGEGFPDIFILKDLADFFGIKVDDFYEDKDVQIKKRRPISQEIIIPSLAILLVWLVTIIAFTIVSITLNDLTRTWLAFIYAIPVSGIVLTIFMAIYKKWFMVLIGTSVIIWGSGLTAFLTSITFSNANWLWLIFIICTPIQLMAILYYLLKVGGKFKESVYKIFNKRRNKS